MRGRARPVPRGRPVEGHAPSPLGVSRVALDLRVPTCRRHYPGGPLGSDRSWGGLFQPFPIHPQRRRPSPSECKVGVHIGRFEACSTFTCVTACRLAASPKRHICLEGSDGFVTSTAAPIATGWSDPVAGWELHPLKSQHLFTAHTQVDLDPNLRPVAMAPQALLQVFRNLTTNAIQAMSKGGTLHLMTRSDPARQAVLAVVADTGPGLAPKR